VNAPAIAERPEPRGRDRLRAKLPWFTLAAACLAADLWTKYLVFYPLRPEGGEPPVAIIASWFRLIIAYNRGVTFGLASGTSTWLLALGTGTVILLLSWQLWATRVDERLKSFALAMIVGGAIGNLYDRSIRPHVELDTRPGVRDFLDWYAPDHWALADWLKEHDVQTHWYTSNVADVLIVCGVILLAWLIITEKPAPSSTGTSTGTSDDSKGAATESGSVA
jgi:signal peptidase II